MPQAHRDEPKTHLVQKGALSMLLRLMLPYWPGLLGCAACMLLVNAADLLKPYAMKIAVDDFLVSGKPQSGLYSLTGLGVGYFLIIVLGALSSLFQARILSRVCQKILSHLRIRVFDHIHRMPLRSLDEMGSGRLLTRATNDIETLNEFYGDVLTGLFRDVFLLIGIVGMMLQMNWRLALVGFAAVPLIALITLLLRKALRQNFVRMKAIIGHINGFIAESVAGMRVIQAFAREKNKVDELKELDRQYRKTTLFQVQMNSLLRPLMEVINTVAIALLLLYGFGQVSASLVEVGVLVAFTTYIKQFFEPINDLAEKYNSVQSALVSADRVFSLLKDDSMLEELDAPGHQGPMRGKIEFRNVWFAYEGEEWVLRGLNLTIEVGRKVAFVGATGAGKTTIVNLLSRFYEPQRGVILVDDVPLSQWQLKALRQRIAVVLQDVFLFTGSIAENIRIHAPISDDDVQRALELSCADGFVDALPGKLHAPVAERGMTFSAGERQLLSFARAIAHDPAILVLDEATANIDTATEELVQRSIGAISQGRTALFIAHRLSTIRACDTICVLDHGVIVQQGTHEQLIAQEGLYAQLCAKL